jgi:hypothetical protein
MHRCCIDAGCGIADFAHKSYAYIFCGNRAARTLNQTDNETEKENHRMRFPVPIAFAAILVIGTSTFAQDAVSDVGKAAKETTHATTKVVKKTAHGTKKATKKTASTAGHAVKKTGQGVKKGVEDVGHEAKKTSTTSPDAPK